VRLDHLLSKEHHEEHSNSWGVGRDGIVRCSGAGRVHNNNSSDFQMSETAGTLLGPEATPLVPCLLGVVLSRHFGGGVWCLVIG
jgi:hypothetical protein